MSELSGESENASKPSEKKDWHNKNGRERVGLIELLYMYDNVNMYMYVCMYVCMYVVCMYAYMYVCMHTCMCLCKYACIYVCMYVCVCVCVCV